MAAQPGPFRYRKLGYLAVNVTDPDRTSTFLETMIGLDPAGVGPDGERFYRCSQDHHDIVVHQAAEPGLKRAGWELEDDHNLDLAFEHFERAGLSPATVDKAATDALGIGRAFRVREPTTGVEFEYYARIRHTIVRFRQNVAKIQRLGHFVVLAPDWEKSVESFTRLFNFRISDQVGELTALMRAWPNPLHHSFGVGRSPEPRARLHHINFMVTDMDDVGRAFWRCQKTDRKIVFGPGRHPPSESVCLYFLDEDGLTWEFSYGMEEFPEENPREPRLMSTALEDIDYWGAVPQPGWGTTAGWIEQSPEAARKKETA